MKVELLRGGEARVPLRAVDDVDLFREAACACTGCKREPVRVSGKGTRPSADDRAYEADAHCYDCGAHLGTIRAEANTLFGVREDVAVLNGRCRVY